MSPLMKSLGIDRMSAAQRILLVEEIRDSLAAMSLPLIITPEAEDDIKEAQAWHENGAPGWGSGSSSASRPLSIKSASFQKGPRRCSLKSDGSSCADSRMESSTGSTRIR